MAESDDQTTAELMRSKGEEITIKSLKECFRKVDVNGDNLISFREFCLAIEELGIQWELDTAKTAFKTMDENGNKSLDWYEFSHGIHLVNPSVKAFWNNIFNPKVPEEEEEPEVLEFTLDEMVECLGDKRSDWRRRNKMLNFLPNYCQELSEEEFQQTMTTIVEALGFQVQERKSAVSREACLAVACLSRDRDVQMLPFVESLFPCLFGAIRMNIKIINESGKNAGRAVVRFVPDNDEGTLLKTLVAGTGEKHKQVRARCYEYAEVLCEQEWTRRRFRENPKYWEMYKSMLVKGTADKDSSARKAAFRSILKLKAFELEDLYVEIEEQLDRAKQRALKRAEREMKKAAKK